MQVLRRKIAQAGTRQTAAEPGGGVDRAFRLSLARAARDAMALALDVTEARQDRRTLAEVMELLPERALMLMLDRNGGDGLGLLVLSPPLLAGLVEMLTTGRVTTAAPPARRPTRTDAAMLGTWVDAALTGMDVALGQDEARLWAGAWRYASFVAEPRTLALLLEDTAYQVLLSEVSLADGAKTGPLILALPDRVPALARDQAAEPAPDHAFAAHLTAQVEEVPARLDAVVARVTMPLARLSGLLPGEVLPLPLAGIDKVRLVGLDGRLVAEGRLGQARGQRAIRLSGEVMTDAAPAILAPRAVAG